VSVFLKTMAKRIIQYNLFDKPTVKRRTKGRHKPSDWERAEQRERLETKKKLQREKEFEDYWRKHGLVQGYMFDQEGNTLI